MQAGIALILVILTGITGPVAAHEVRPGYLQLTQTDETTFRLLFKVPAQGELRLGLYPVLPDSCSTIGESVASITGGAYIERATLTCRDGLASGVVSVDGLSRVFTDVLARVERLDGTVQVVRLTPASPSFKVEPSPQRLDIARAYAVLGVEHILGGIDHLLFVLALLLLISNRRRLVVTITAFTLAHSITLAGATLGLVRVPQQPVEAVIALSIVFIAAEMSHRQPSRPGVTRRWPWIVAFIFGLLHGFGFAGALSEIGLPQQAIPVALLMFNVGVEVGQLMFIGAAMILVWVARRLQFDWPQRLEWLPAYAIGSVAAFWTIERTVGVWG